MGNIETVLSSSIAAVFFAAFVEDFPNPPFPKGRA